MKKQRLLKNFSIKKLLLTILCSVIVCVFIGMTKLYIEKIPTYVQQKIYRDSGKELNYYYREMGNEYQESYERISKSFDEDRNLYGEDYPAEGLLIYYLIAASSSMWIVETYTMSVLIGIALGTIIYIVAIQNIKGKQLIVELIAAFIIMFILMMLLNVGYKVLVDKMILSLDETVNPDFFGEIYDLENNNVLIPYILVVIAIYVINFVRQKIVAYRLNKELNKNN